MLYNNVIGDLDITRDITNYIPNYMYIHNNVI